jgi:hypothetical protein
MQIRLSYRNSNDGERSELLVGRQQFEFLGDELEAQGSFLAELFMHEPLVRASDLRAGCALLLDEPVSDGISPAEWDEFLAFLDRSGDSRGVRIAEI